MLRFIQSLLKLRFKLSLAFRIDTLFNFLSQVIYLLASIFLFEIIYLKIGTNAIVGWNMGECIILVGTYYLFTEIHSSLFKRGLMVLPDIIRKGNLEHYLLRPVPTSIFITLSRVDLSGIWRIFPGILVLIYGFKFVGLPDLSSFFFYALSLILAIFIYTIAVFCISVLGFWFLNVNNMFYIFYDLIEFARYPDVVYRGAIRKIFTTIIPIIVLASFPTRILLNKGSLILLFNQLLLALSFFVLSVILWKLGLRRYQGRG